MPEMGHGWAGIVAVIAFFTFWRWRKPVPACDHGHWHPLKHGRHCTCGALMYDPGD